MKFVDEYRRSDLIETLSAEINRLSTRLDGSRTFKFMEVCGGHTHTIYKHGIEDVLPASIDLIHGPGCPVCVLPMGRVDDAIAIARTPGVIFTTFGDMMRARLARQPAGCSGRRRRCALRLFAPRRPQTCPPEPQPASGVLRDRL